MAQSDNHVLIFVNVCFINGLLSSRVLKGLFFKFSFKTATLTDYNGSPVFCEVIGHWYTDCLFLLQHIIVPLA